MLLNYLGAYSFEDFVYSFEDFVGGCFLLSSHTCISVRTSHRPKGHSLQFVVAS